MGCLIYGCISAIYILDHYIVKNKTIKFFEEKCSEFIYEQDMLYNFAESLSDK